MLGASVHAKHIPTANVPSTCLLLLRALGVCWMPQGSDCRSPVVQHRASYGVPARLRAQDAFDWDAFEDTSSVHSGGGDVAAVTEMQTRSADEDAAMAVEGGGGRSGHDRLAHALFQAGGGGCLGAAGYDQRVAAVASLLTAATAAERAELAPTLACLAPRTIVALLGALFRSSRSEHELGTHARHGKSGDAAAAAKAVLAVAAAGAGKRPVKGAARVWPLLRLVQVGAVAAEGAGLRAGLADALGALASKYPNQVIPVVLERALPAVVELSERAATHAGRREAATALAAWSGLADHPLTDVAAAVKRTIHVAALERRAVSALVGALDAAKVRACGLCAVRDTIRLACFAWSGLIDTAVGEQAGRYHGELLEALLALAPHEGNRAVMVAAGITPKLLLLLQCYTAVAPSASTAMLLPVGEAAAAEDDDDGGGGGETAAELHERKAFEKELAAAVLRCCAACDDAKRGLLRAGAAGALSRLLHPNPGGPTSTAVVVPAAARRHAAAALHNLAVYTHAAAWQVRGARATERLVTLLAGAADGGGGGKNKGLTDAQRSQVGHRLPMILVPWLLGQGPGGVFIGQRFHWS